MKVKAKNLEKGITLIALIITIIVLLILAGVTLKVVIDSNLINNSKTATEMYKIEDYKERITVITASEKIGKVVDNKQEVLKDLVVNRLLNEDWVSTVFTSEEVDYLEEDQIKVITKDNYGIIARISEDGNIEWGDIGKEDGEPYPKITLEQVTLTEENNEKIGIKVTAEVEKLGKTTKIDKIDLIINGEIKETRNYTTLKVEDTFEVNKNDIYMFKATTDKGKSSSKKLELILPKYTISYNANGGTGELEPQTKDYGENVVLNADNPTRVGYTFLGWSEDETATEAKYSAKDTYTSNKNVTLYAVWDYNFYITIYTDGTVGISPNSTKISGKTIQKDYGNDYASYIDDAELSTKRNVKTVIFTGKVIPDDTRMLFRGYANLTTIQNINNLDTSNVSNMSFMFTGCGSLESLDVSNFNTSKVTDMDSMFFSCVSLTSLNLSSFDTSNVTNMYEMFYNCPSLISLNVSSFNTSNVANMQEMFIHCKSVRSLDVSGFNTSNVTDMAYMFYECQSITSLNLSNFDTSKVADMHGMFGSCKSLNSINLSSFNTINVTDMSSMFSGCDSLTSLDISNFNTGNATDMRGMFAASTKLTRIYVGTGWKTAQANTTEMFKNCGTSSVIEK